MPMRTPVMAGNWKMHTSLDEAVALTSGVAEGAASVSGVEMIVCPPSIWLARVSEIVRGGPVQAGAQNMHHEAAGAFTGEVAPAMVKELASHVILGHSERRRLFGETDDLINKKVRAALEVGLVPILAIGERLDEREAGMTEAVIERQLRDGLQGIEAPGDLIVAYEPVWAIGTGRAATPETANETIAFARSILGGLYGGPFASAARILYGGSVNTENVAGLMAMPEIDGGLVGGACLKVDSFLTLAREAAAARA